MWRHEKFDVHVAISLMKRRNDLPTAATAAFAARATPTVSIAARHFLPLNCEFQSFFLTEHAKTLRDNF